MLKLEENVHLLHVVSWGWRYIWCLFKHTTKTSKRQKQGSRKQKTEEELERVTESRWRRQSLILPSQSANPSVSSEPVKLQCEGKTAAQPVESVSVSDSNMISKNDWNCVFYLIELSTSNSPNVSNNVQTGEIHKFTEGHGVFHDVIGHFNFQQSVEERD